MFRGIKEATANLSHEESPVKEEDVEEVLLKKIVAEREHPLRDALKKWLKRKLRSIQKAQQEAEQIELLK